MPSLVCPECNSTDLQAADEKQYRCKGCGALLGQYLLPGDSLNYCPQCRAIVLPEAVFCHQCGSELPMLQSLLALKACPACGRLIPASAFYCSYCRALVRPEYADTPATAGNTGHYRESVGCPACGRTIGHTATACRYCGVNVPEFIARVRQAGLNLGAFDQRLGQERQQRAKSASAPGTSQGTAALVGMILVIVVLFINWALSKLVVDRLVVAEGMQEFFYIGLMALLALGQLGLVVAWLRAKYFHS